MRLFISAKRRAGFLREEATSSLKEMVNKTSTMGREVDPTTIYKHHVCILSIEHLFISLFDSTHLLQVWAKRYLYDDL